MAPRKLSDSDKSDIIELYRQPDQTTSTLASQYGVSNSTISRILKLSLPPEEYSQLISQKRMAGGADKAETAKAKPEKNKAKKQSGRKRRSRKSVKEESIAEESAASSEEASSTDSSPTAAPKLKKAAQETGNEKETASEPRRRRRRSRKATEDDEQLPLLTAEETTEETDEAETGDDEDSKRRTSTTPAPILAKDRAADDEEEDDDDDDPLAGLDETLGDDFGDDDLDEEEEEDDDDDDTVEVPKPKLQTRSAMSIMPLDEAIFPKPCYLVVDMRAELITRPLSEFADLGQVPSSEEKSKTLPVFDNHRVARRFSRNKQRVIKVPDGDVIMRTSPYLTAKGITRLLVDGQVFDLVGMK